MRSDTEFASFLARVLAECRAGDVPAISAETGDFLASLVREYGTKNLLEIGTAHGYSTLRLADAIGEGGHIVTVEFSTPSYAHANVYFAESGLSHRIRSVFANALAYIAELAPDQFFDAAFVDGEKKRTVEFLDAVWPRVRAGGWIVVDDAIKFRWKMAGLDEWLEGQWVVYEFIQTDPDDGILLIRKPIIAQNDWFSPSGIHLHHA